MTLQQLAYNKIDRMSDEGIRFFLDFIDRVDNLRIFAVNADTEQSDGNSTNDNGESLRMQEKTANNQTDDFFSFIDGLSSEDINGLTKVDKKKLFLQSGGRIHYDENAYWELRERSIL